MSDATQAKVWEIEARPFGDSATITGTANLNLRFPGQYADQESGLNYNYFRDYNPNIGRYIESDPIGIKQGDNHIFGYAQANPTKFVDINGLEIWVCNRKVRGPVGLGGGSDGAVGGNHAYFWDDRNKRCCGRASTEKCSELGPPSDSCRMVVGSAGKEDEIMKCCKDNADKGLWVPPINDCHTAVDKCLGKSKLRNPGPPGGRVGKPCDPCKDNIYRDIG